MLRKHNQSEKTNQKGKFVKKITNKSNNGPQLAFPYTHHCEKKNKVPQGSLGDFIT